MKSNTVRNALAAGILAAMSGYAVQASAAFTFTEVAAFTNAIGGGAATPINSILYSGAIDLANAPAPGTQPPLYSTMSWLINTSPQSDLILSNPAAGSALPVATWTTITTITQDNRIIPGPLNWSNQSIFGRLQIFDDTGGLQKVADDTTEDVVSFVETDNQGYTGAGIPDPTNCGLPNPNGSQCDDIFTLNSFDLAPLEFTANDGSKWVVEFRFFNLVNAVFDGVDKLYTAEDSRNSIDVQARITQFSEVAEPGTLTLLGIGLLGLGFVGRRRQRGSAA